MGKIMTLLTVGVFCAAGAAAQPPPRQKDFEFLALRDAYLAKFRPLWLEAQAADWEANVSGADAAFARKTAADKALLELHSDRELFAQLKALHDGRQVSDRILQRELDVMYRTFLPAQADPRLTRRVVELESELTQVFNTHRGQVGERRLSENDIRDVLARSTDSAEARAAWNAYMEVGVKARDKLREVVRLRNEIARQLGFSDYHALALTLQEIDGKELLRLFDQLDELTRAPFARLKAEIDAARAARFGVAAEELRPWHFGDLFFQEAPSGQDNDLDQVYQDVDLVRLVRDYYDSVGLPCADVLERSDLFEKPGKNPHAFCTDLDRAGDIRTLCNLKPNLYWADTLLHELGHAVYSKFIRRDVPFLLRQASHGITTEGVAQMFGSLAKNEEWLTRMRGLEPAAAARLGAAARARLRTEKLIFSRWAQVMVRFEHAMYTQPDQDLNALWWELKKRYQLLNPPEGTDRADYAAKVHVLTTPVYYHNYVLGELFAAQLRHHLARKVLDGVDPAQVSFVGRSEVGHFLRHQVFGPGNTLFWDDLIKRATGEPLTPRYFAEEYVR